MFQSFCGGTSGATSSSGRYPVETSWKPIYTMNWKGADGCHRATQRYKGIKAAFDPKSQNSESSSNLRNSRVTIQNVKRSTKWLRETGCPPPRQTINTKEKRGGQSKTTKTNTINQLQHRHRLPATIQIKLGQRIMKSAGTSSPTSQSRSTRS